MWFRKKYYYIFYLVKGEHASAPWVATWQPCSIVTALSPIEMMFVWAKENPNNVMVSWQMISKKEMKYYNANGQALIKQSIAEIEESLKLKYG
jgi:hypothetical protein